VSTERTAAAAQARSPARACCTAARRSAARAAQAPRRRAPAAPAAFRRRRRACVARVAAPAAARAAAAARMPRLRSGPAARAAAARGRRMRMRVTARRCRLTRCLDSGAVRGCVRGAWFGWGLGWRRGEAAGPAYDGPRQARRQRRVEGGCTRFAMGHLRAIHCWVCVLAARQPLEGPQRTPLAPLRAQAARKSTPPPGDARGQLGVGAFEAGPYSFLWGRVRRSATHRCPPFPAASARPRSGRPPQPRPPARVAKGTSPSAGDRPPPPTAVAATHDIFRTNPIPPNPQPRQAKAPNRRIETYRSTATPLFDAAWPKAAWFVEGQGRWGVSDMSECPLKVSFVPLGDFIKEVRAGKGGGCPGGGVA
jgi:hypothetical protein